MDDKTTEALADIDAGEPEKFTADVTGADEARSDEADDATSGLDELGPR